MFVLTILLALLFLAGLCLLKYHMRIGFRVAQIVVTVFFGMILPVQPMWPLFILWILASLVASTIKSKYDE